MELRMRSTSGGVRVWVRLFGIAAIIALGTGLMRIGVSGAWRTMAPRDAVITGLLMVASFLIAGIGVGFLGRFATSVFRAMGVGAIIATPICFAIGLIFFDDSLLRTLVIATISGMLLGAFYGALLYTPDK